MTDNQIDFDDYLLHPEKYNLADYQNLELNRNIGILTEQFDMIAKDKKKKIPESVFVKNFLPLFFGINEFGQANSFQETTDIYIKHYIGIAGSLFSAVDVVSDVNGEVLFEIPPLAERNVLVNLETDTNLGSLLEAANNIAKVKPNHANDLRYASLAERIALLDGKSAMSIMNKYLDKWNLIADRYNLPRFVDKSLLEKKEEVVSNEEKPGDDELTFDL